MAIDFEELAPYDDLHLDRARLAGATTADDGELGAEAFSRYRWTPFAMSCGIGGPRIPVSWSSSETSPMLLQEGLIALIGASEQESLDVELIARLAHFDAITDNLPK